MSKSCSDQISRRNILRCTLAGVVGLGVSRAHAQSQSGIRGQEGKKTLKASSSQARHMETAHSVFFDECAAELTARTGGDVGAVFFGDSQLGPEDKYTTQINFGTMDMMFTVSY